MLVSWDFRSASHLWRCVNPRGSGSTTRVPFLPTVTDFFGYSTFATRSVSSMIVIPIVVTSTTGSHSSEGLDEVGWIAALVRSTKYGYLELALEFL